MNSKVEIKTSQDASQELLEVWSQFQLAHHDYHRLIKDEQAIRESNVYSDSVEELFSEPQQKLKLWLEQPIDQSQPNESIQPPEQQIQPEDSVSSVGSRRSSRHSRTSSLRSTSSAKAKVAARQAALEAKANALQRMHELQLEELKIQQLKSQVQLQAEIAAVETEKRVYEQTEIEETQSERLPQQSAVEQRSLPIPSRNTTPPPPPQRLEKISESNLEQQQTSNQQPKKDPEVIQPTERPLNPSAAQWSPNMAPGPQQPVTHVGDQAFHQLMETQDRQGVALQQIVQQQEQSVMALTLPKPTIKVFTGDPINYSDFVRGFEHLVEEKTPCLSSRLYYLIQYISGPVQELHEVVCR